jgi:Ca2+-transporting ATPase
VRNLGPEQHVEHARSMALAMLVCGSATVTAGLSRLRGRSAWAIAIASIVSAAVLIQIAPLARLLHLAPLHLDDWLVAAVGGLAAGSLSALFTRVRAVYHENSR